MCESTLDPVLPLVVLNAYHGGLSKGESYGLGLPSERLPSKSCCPKNR